MVTVLRCSTRMVLSLMVVAALQNAASAQEAEKAFYAGKTVRMIVGSGTGGGYDVFSRMIARPCSGLARSHAINPCIDACPGPTSPRSRISLPMPV